MTVAIEIAHLSKSFPKPGRKNHAASSDRLTVLQDISLRVEKGGAYGIIGANGCGKSTLLKIISGILVPDEGEVVIHGRTAAILELGTGFHPDMSGRDNIFFNAALLSYNKREVEQVLEDIIAFSELGDFIEVPVKNYSSGMYLRLAFSIIAFLKADILILDEVFAVGDNEFRRKCIDRLSLLKKEGMTILLVSHDFNQIAAICDECVLIQEGRIARHGSTREVLDTYINHFFLKQHASEHLPSDSKEKTIWKDADHSDIASIKLRSSTNFRYSRSEEVAFSFIISLKSSKPIYLSFVLYYRFSELSLGAASFYTKQPAPAKPLSGPGLFEWKVVIPGNILNTGMFLVELYVLDEHSHEILHLPNIAMFHLLEDNPCLPFLDHRPPQSAIFALLDWQVKKIES
jgi:ABC-type polysaccharide/polyol phosphate transport system ATPase subunit